MGLQGTITRKFKEKREKWRAEARTRETEKQAYKAAFKAEQIKQTGIAMKDQIKKDARAAARADVAKGFGKGGRSGPRAGSIMAGLDAMSKGAMGTMGFGPSIQELARKKRKRKKRSPTRQPQYQGLSFM